MRHFIKPEPQARWNGTTPATPTDTSRKGGAE